MNQIIEEGRRFASAADMKVSDMSANSPVGTTLAILERTLKVMSAVQARIHYSMKQELVLLRDIIRDYTPDEYDYAPEDDSDDDEEDDRKAKKADYDMVEVIPVSDPNAATMAQKIVQYQAVMQLAQSAPQLYDMSFLHRQMIEVLGVKNADKLVKVEDDAIPVDPIQENQNILNGKPVKAFIEQNHQAHIQVHMSAIQNPKIQQMMQQNPAAQIIMAAAMAHINEHVALEYRKQVETEMGMVLPGEDVNKKITPEQADQIAVAAAKASQQLLQRDQQQAQQQAAQQQMQDPVVQMQMQQLQIQQQDLQLKAQKQQLDAAAKADQIRVEEARIEAQKEIAAMQVGAQAATARDKLKQQMELEGTRLGADIAKNKEQAQQRMSQQRMSQNRTPRKEN
jgi:hypothetical protein